MALLEQLQADMKQAMKAGEKQKLGVLRMLINEVQNADLQASKPTPQQALEAYAKRLKKNADEFDRIGRADEVSKLREEITLTESYLPKKLGRDETEQRIDAFLAANTFTEKQFGQAMGALMKAHPGELDAAVASPLLKAKLAGK
ncbi:MAG TPA: GatB/YqeY domain-containing protein [Tepidisphaeraceae bacterium]|jgi:hypothetical protein